MTGRGRQIGNVINYDNPRTIMPIPQREIDYDPTLVHFTATH